ncbi:MAG: oligoendopeptidase F family protein, partial [Treponema sp.]|nr:oligoendopeptidase F family protein [Treponema sp.]
MSEEPKRIPERHEIPVTDTWDLSTLFASDEAWEQALGEYEKMIEKLPSYKGTLARSAESLADYMDFSRDLDILGGRLGVYGIVRQGEDERCNKARAMNEKNWMTGSKRMAAGAWADPELLAIPEADIAMFLEHPRLADYRMYIGRILRLRPHTLSAAEERIAALYEEGAGTSAMYSALVNVDMDVDLGSIDTPGGQIELSKDTQWWKLLESPDREIRRKVHEKNSARWEAHKTTLASFMSAEVKQNAIRARVRGYPSARAAALFPDNVGEEVYDNLIATVGESLDSLHRYYGLRKRMLGLDELRAYDLTVPLVRPVKRRTNWNEAVGLLSDALRPLGDEYVSTLRSGLLGRWVDRYMNQGKGGTPFSAAAYGSDPYILMTYDEDKIEDIVCLAHESGHSMHTWYSHRSNPFRHAAWSQFEAETASAFHVELLFRHMLKTAGDDMELRLYLVNSQVDYFINMLYTCTRNAEFAHVAHRLEESGTPLTVDVLRNECRRLVEKYRGPEFAMEESASQFFGFFSYLNIYIYASGVSAAIALADRVLGGGENERADYSEFLKT